MANKIIKKIAQDRLIPYGVLQKGQSRTFLYDKGWYTIVIEFQPFTNRKGTCLNVGVDLHFYPRDYFAYCYGYRLSDFKAFTTDEQFSLAVNGLCDVAIKRVQELDEKFLDVGSALKTMEKKAGGDATWQLYQVAILNALNNNFEKAKIQLRKVCEENCESDGDIERRKVAQEILTWTKEESTFTGKLTNLMNQTRQLKKLPPYAVEYWTASKSVPDSAAQKSWLTQIIELFKSR